MGSRIALSFSSAAVAAALVSLSIPAAAQESCAALKAMSQATDAFASLRSERLPGGGWRSTLIPVGFKGCTVEDKKGDAVVTCSNDFAESDKPSTLMEPVVEQFKDCIGSGWKARRVRGTDEGVSIAVIYNESPVEFEVRFEKERSGGADAMGLATSAWKYRVSLKAFTPARDATLPSLGPREPEVFCSSLKALLAAAPGAFKDVKGEQLSERRWKPSHVLQGLNDCRVTQLRSGTTFYTCEAEFESRSALAAAQRLLASETVMCLGIEWRHSRWPDGDGVWNFTVDREEKGPKVSIRGESDDDKFTLNFDVDPK